ncbi:MAG TPA: polysaccharide deacetylase family protein [Proteiniclasticum sp.]|nr:polysaccharide deacetylase family protein [Proteiniclasticum sp.]
MKKKNIFGNSGGTYYRSKKSSKGILIIGLLVVVIGTALGFTIFKLIGENKFTSKTPIIVEQEKEEEPVAEVIVAEPGDLVENSNHIHKASDYAYSTKDVRNWITEVEPYDGEKIAFLTFDDGPSPQNTGKILDILKEKDAAATFFTIGSSIENSNASGDVLNRILDEGSSIALHSYTHVYEKLYPNNTADKDYIKEELDRLQEKIREVTGRDQFKSNVLRYPGGHMSWKEIAAADAYLAEDGIEYIDWNAMNGDSEPTARRPKDPEALAAFVMESLVFTNVKDVVVVLMHDAENKGMTTESLPMIIDTLRNEGYKFGILK